jgi:hypothetical protein
VEAGSHDDCFAILCNLCDDGFRGIATVDEVLGWCEAFVSRFRKGDGVSPAYLNSRSDNGDGYTWREILGYAATMIGAWRAAGLLKDPERKERAHALLAEMNRPSLAVSEAGNELHRLIEETG